MSTSLKKFEPVRFVTHTCPREMIPRPLEFMVYQKGFEEEMQIYNEFKYRLENCVACKEKRQQELVEAVHRA